MLAAAVHLNLPIVVLPEKYPPQAYNRWTDPWFHRNVIESAGLPRSQQLVAAIGCGAAVLLTLPSALITSACNLCSGCVSFEVCRFRFFKLLAVGDV